MVARVHPPRISIDLSYHSVVQLIIGQVEAAARLPDAAIYVCYSNARRDRLIRCSYAGFLLLVMRIRLFVECMSNAEQEAKFNEGG